jgi:hypothetical protein
VQQAKRQLAMGLAFYANAANPSCPMTKIYRLYFSDLGILQPLRQALAKGLRVPTEVFGHFLVPF